jgi:hypothetical protein
MTTLYRSRTDVRCLMARTRWGHSRGDLRACGTLVYILAGILADLRSTNLGSHLLFYLWVIKTLPNWVVEPPPPFWTILDAPLQVYYTYCITSIKGARCGYISKRGALNRNKSSIIQSAITLRTKLAILGHLRKPVTVYQKCACFSRSQTRFFAANSYVLCERTFLTTLFMSSHIFTSILTHILWFRRFFTLILYKLQTFFYVLRGGAPLLGRAPLIEVIRYVSKLPP